VFFFLTEQYAYVCGFFCYSLLMPDDNSLVTTRNACRLRGDQKIFLKRFGLLKQDFGSIDSGV